MLLHFSSNNWSRFKVGTWREKFCVWKYIQTEYIQAFSGTSKGKDTVLLVGKEKKKVSQKLCEGEENKTVPGRQGQRPEYQEVGSGDRRLSGWRGVGAFSAQGTRVLKHPRLCLSRRTPSRSHGLLTQVSDEDAATPKQQRHNTGAEWK